MKRLHIVIGSTRPSRQGHLVARWVEAIAREHPAFDPVLIDLRDIDLPMYDEPHHPTMRRYEHAHTKAWSASVAAADAFVFVTPEYNFNPPPSLINALDYLYFERNYKPAGLVSYGGASGGIRAAQALKSHLTTYKIMPMVEAVALPYFAKAINGETFAPDDAADKAAVVMLDELGRWANALASLRKED